MCLGTSRETAKKTDLGTSTVDPSECRLRRHKKPTPPVRESTALTGVVNIDMKKRKLQLNTAVRLGLQYLLYRSCVKKKKKKKMCACTQPLKHLEILTTTERSTRMSVKNKNKHSTGLATCMYVLLFGSMRVNQPERSSDLGHISTHRMGYAVRFTDHRSGWAAAVELGYCFCCVDAWIRWRAYEVQNIDPRG